MERIDVSDERPKPPVLTTRGCADLSRIRRTLIEPDAWSDGIATGLVRHGVRTWGDLERVDLKELFYEKGVGRRHFNKLKDQMVRLGLEWKHSSGPRMGKSLAVVASPPKLGVYFIQTEGFIKIGYAINVRRRFRQLAMSVPFDLELLAVIACPDVREAKETERTLHRRFKAQRVRGEWFRLIPPLTEFIDEIRICPEA